MITDNSYLENFIKSLLDLNPISSSISLFYKVIQFADDCGIDVTYINDNRLQQDALQEIEELKSQYTEAEVV